MIKRLSPIAAAALAAAAMGLGPAMAQAPAAPAGEVLISRPGDRLENVLEDSDGTIYATGVLSGNVWRRARDGKVDSFFQAPNPQAILPAAGGYLVDYQDRAPDVSGGRLTLAGLGQHLVVLDRKGKVKKTLAGPDEKAFYKGMARFGATGVFISDTGGDRILWANLATGRVEPWLDSDRTHEPNAPASTGGGPSFPSGLKLHDGWVYFSRGDIWRIQVGPNGKPTGALQLAGMTGGTDDFDVAADGTIYASRGSDVLKVSPEGLVSTFIKGGCPSCTAIRVSRDGRSLYLAGGAIPRPGAAAVPGYVSRVSLANPNEVRAAAPPRSAAPSPAGPSPAAPSSASSAAPRAAPSGAPPPSATPPSTPPRRSGLRDFLGKLRPD